MDVDKYGHEQIWTWTNMDMGKLGMNKMDMDKLDMDKNRHGQKRTCTNWTKVYKIIYHVGLFFI